MNGALLLFFLGAGTAAGFAVVRLAGRDLSRRETLAWSFAAGLLVHASLELALLAARLRPGPKKLLLGDLAILGLSLLVRKPQVSRALSTAPPRPRSRAALWLAPVAAAGVLLFFLAAISRAPFATDYMAIWGLKGRTIFETASIPSRLFHDPAIEWAHPEYPLLLPLTFAALSAAIRSWDDRALTLLYPFCQLATVLAVWGFLSRRVSENAGAVAAVLTALCARLYAPVNVGTAEIPMALGFVLVSCAALEAAAEDTPSIRIRLGMASFFCAATKQEGTLFVVLLAAMILWSRRRAGGGRILALAAIAPVFLHGAVLRLFRGPVLSRDFDLTLLAPSRWSDLLVRLGIVGQRLVSVELRASALPIAAILLSLFLTRRGPFDKLLGPLIIQALIYAGVCAFCAFGPVWLVEASFSRITLTLFPTLVLVLAARFPSPEPGIPVSGS